MALGLEKALRRAYISPNLGIERSIRKANRTPPEISATPSTEEAAYRYMEDIGDRALKDRQFATDVALKEKMMSETSRQADINSRFSNEELAIWKSQNNLATLLSAGATAMTGLGGFVALNQAKKRDITQQKILDTAEESKRIQREGNIEGAKRQKDFFDKLLQRHYGYGVGDKDQMYW